MSTAHYAGHSFSVHGSRNGSSVAVSWSPGSLRGDPPTVDLMLAELEIASASRGDPICGSSLDAIVPDRRSSPLHDPHATYSLVERVLDSIRDVEAQPADLAAELQRRRQARQ